MNCYILVPDKKEALRLWFISGGYYYDNDNDIDDGGWMSKTTTEAKQVYKFCYEKLGLHLDSLVFIC